MRILVAEDERITRRSLERALMKWGHDVVAAEDGVVAWEAFQAEPFDIVVTDWEMPRMDGLELVRRIRREGGASYAYLLMLTARSDKSDLVAGMEAGADDFLAKPFDRDELRVRLAAGERIISLERNLADRNVRLEAANERMHKDLRAAAKVQQELLPTKLPELGGLRFAWRYRPCDELGGDLLNVVPVGAGNEAAMYLADVSGHGVAASLVSVSVHRSLSVRQERSSIIMRHGDGNDGARATSADEVTHRLNTLYPMSSNGGHFVTVVYAIVHAATRELEYSAAGHPGPTIARRGEAIRSLDSHGFPIGVVDGAEFGSTTVALEAGDRVYLYSDGLLEAMNASGDQFGVERINAVIDETRDQTIDDSLDALIDAATAWQGADQFADDVSILALEVPDED